MSKDAKPPSSLVQAAKNSLAAGGGQGGPVVDMQDLLPVIQSFQDHMAAEQARQRGRIRGLVTMFVLALGVALALPLWVVRGLLRDNQAALAAQRSEQTQSSHALELALRDLADSSRALREALSQERLQVVPPGPVPAPETAPLPPKTEPAAPVKVAPPEPPAPLAVAQEKTPAEPVAVKPTDLPTNNAAPVPSAPVPTNIPATVSAATDLEKMLKQIEQSIAEKQRQLQQKR